MAHDVFLCYSSRDKLTVNAACAVLEAANIRCWVAPRDVLPGADWGESIIDAINRSRAMVLVFSNNANNSLQVKREVERAVNKGIPIIPLRIEEIIPTKSLEYFISSSHWLDAFTPPLERHLNALSDALQRILNVPDKSRPAVNPWTNATKQGPFDKVPATGGSTGSRWWRIRRLPLALALVVGIAIIVVASRYWQLFWPQPDVLAHVDADVNRTTIHPTEFVPYKPGGAAIRPSGEPVPTNKVLEVWRIGVTYDGPSPDDSVAEQDAQTLLKSGITLSVKMVSAHALAPRLKEAIAQNQLPDVIQLWDQTVERSFNDSFGHFDGLGSIPGASQLFRRVTRYDNAPLRGINYLVRSSRNYQTARNILFQPPICRWGSGNSSNFNDNFVSELAVKALISYLSGDIETLQKMSGGDVFLAHLDSVHKVPSDLRGKIEEPMSGKAVNLNLMGLTNCGFFGTASLRYGEAVGQIESPETMTQELLFVMFNHVGLEWRLAIVAPNFLDVETATRLHQHLRDDLPTGNAPFPAQLISPADLDHGNGTLSWRTSRTHDVIAEIMQIQYDDLEYFTWGADHLTLRFVDSSSGGIGQKLFGTGHRSIWRIWSISSTGGLTPSETRTFLPAP